MLASILEIRVGVCNADKIRVVLDFKLDSFLRQYPCGSSASIGEDQLSFYAVGGLVLALDFSL
jgi:hypothetical protein